MGEWVDLRCTLYCRDGYRQVWTDIEKKVEPYESRFMLLSIE